MILERTFAWFAGFQGLTVRYNRLLDIVHAFHLIAASPIPISPTPSADRRPPRSPLQAVR